jgi:hypothetical protein
MQSRVAERNEISPAGTAENVISDQPELTLGGCDASYAFGEGEP